MAKEKFISAFGPIYVDSDDFCVGCPNFYPVCKQCLKLDENQNIVHTNDEFHAPVNEGVAIYCSNRFLCQTVARDTKERIWDICAHSTTPIMERP